jgi:hypothetical protein
MSKNAMAGAVTLCGVGLCMIGGALLMQNGAQAHATGGVMPAAAALASAAKAQAGPTVVWYDSQSHKGSGAYDSRLNFVLYRGWSDGTVEMKIGRKILVQCGSGQCVDSADLASVLESWGGAPRAPFPPSDCPLNLINP